MAFMSRRNTPQFGGLDDYLKPGEAPVPGGAPGPGTVPGGVVGANTVPGENAQGKNAKAAGSGAGPTAPAFGQQSNTLAPSTGSAGGQPSGSAGTGATESGMFPHLDKYLQANSTQAKDFGQKLGGAIQGNVDSADKSLNQDKADWDKGADAGFFPGDFTVQDTHKAGDASLKTADNVVTQEKSDAPGQPFYSAFHLPGTTADTSSHTLGNSLFDNYLLGSTAGAMDPVRQAQTNLAAEHGRYTDADDTYAKKFAAWKAQNPLRTDRWGDPKLTARAPAPPPGVQVSSNPADYAGSTQAATNRNIADNTDATSTDNPIGGEPVTVDGPNEPPVTGR
jgi:hypothetical protein